MRELDPSLTPEQKNMIRQVVASLEIEDMHPSEENIRMLEDIAAGRKSVEQAIGECLDKGIDDMEAGRVHTVDEAFQIVRERVDKES